jgi:flagellar basal-body rod protein FlgB
MIEHLMGSENYELAKKLLDAAELRHEAIAVNLANVETPGFRRIDLSADFEQQLESFASGSGSMSISDLTPSLSEDPTARAVRPDGNNVQLDEELLEMNRNSIEYEFLTQYASGSIKRLQTAITGHVS